MTKKQLEKLKIGALVKIHWKDAVEYMISDPSIINKLDLNVNVGWVLDHDDEAVSLVHAKDEVGFMQKSAVFIIGKNTIQKVRLL